VTLRHLFASEILLQKHPFREPRDPPIAACNGCISMPLDERRDMIPAKNDLEKIPSAFTAEAAPSTQPASTLPPQTHTRQRDASVTTAPMLVLYQPDIPQNCGTMLRLCACLGIDAAIIEPAGFPVSDRNFRRAGMDYLDHVSVTRHVSFTAFRDWQTASGRRLVLLSTQAALPYTEFCFQPGDILLVGRESAGVPETVHAQADASIRIPMQPPMRSLNVAVAAAMVLGEALRQCGRFQTGDARP